MPSKISWGYTVGTVTSLLLFPPAVSVIGGITSGLIVSMWPHLNETVGRVALSQASGKMLTEIVERVPGCLNANEIEYLNRDLQIALRDAFCQALYDIGGETCFPKVWKSKAWEKSLPKRDVPNEVVYPHTAEGHHLWYKKNPLAGHVCDSLNNMVKAAKDGTLFWHGS